MWNQNAKSHEIKTAALQLDVLSSNIPDLIPPELYSTDLKIINDDKSFEVMMNELSEQEEIALDLEGNNDHSFLGNSIVLPIL